MRSEESSRELIRIEQLPIIREQLEMLREEVDAAVQDALALECTADTVTTVKVARADLNRQFQELEQRRKEVKKAILGPYEQFEEIYAECVSSRFQSADRALREKINTVEREIKQKCEDGLRAYFDELRIVNHLDWLRFEMAGIKVDMASAKQKTPKKLREQIAAFVSAAVRDVDTIADMADAEELLAEYKQRLSLTEAIRTVEDRHRRIEAEKERLLQYTAVKEAQQEVVAKVEAAAPPIEVEPEEQTFRCTFTVVATKQQLVALKNYMITEGIKYE